MIASVKLHDDIPVELKALEQLPDAELAYLRAGCQWPEKSIEQLDPYLREAIEYVLSSEGSLMRAQLGYMAMRAVGAEKEAARDFGVAVEYFHTASLLFDDMPAMDGATYRRGKLCPHVKFCEADATLAALALITQGYDLFFGLLLGQPVKQAQAARRTMTECLGAQGILSGQSADVHYHGRSATAEDVLTIAAGKTGTLLRLLLEFPARWAGLPESMALHLEQLAGHWGHSYQVLDDFKDCLHSESETGKTVRRDATLDRPNFLIKSGRESAWRYLTGTLAASNELVRDLVAVDRRWSGLSILQRTLEFRATTFGRALQTECAIS